MAQSARNYDKGIFPPARDDVGGLVFGEIVQPTTAASDGTPRVIAPSGTAPELQKFYGVVEYRPVVGGSGTAAGENLAVKRQGLGVVNLGANLSATVGDRLIADATTLGCVKARTAYSSSATIVGTAEETLSSASSAQALEAYIQPYHVEVVRPVIAGTTSTFGANTKYLGAVGSTQPSSQVPLYVARFAGETIRSLYANLGTAPGGSDTVAFTVQKSSDNGGTWSDTALTCTITGSAKSASDLTHSAVLAAGDLLAVKTVSSATTAAAATVTFDVT